MGAVLGDNGAVAHTELAPRRPMAGIISVWVLAAVAGVLIGVFVPPAWRGQWLVLAVGASLLVAFGIQLSAGESKGFIGRVALSVFGGALVLGIISLGFGLAAVVPG
jgi:hypothetical protein